MPKLPASCAKTEPIHVPPGRGASREETQAENVSYRTYGSRHVRTTQPVRRHRHGFTRPGRPASRPGRVRGGGRQSGMAQVRQHRQRAHGRQDHQHRHGTRARPVRGGDRRPRRRIRRAQASGLISWPVSRRCPRRGGDSTTVGRLSQGQQASRPMGRWSERLSLCQRRWPASEGGRGGAQATCGGRGVGRGLGAGHVRQPGDRVHHRPDRARAGRRGAGHGGRAAARRAGRRVPAAARPLVQPSEVRPAVRGALLRHRAARHGRGHPEVPGIGADQGHRPGDGRAHGGAFRRGHHARHRGDAGPAGRGRRAGAQAHRDDRRRLGRAEGDQGGDDLPAGRRGVDVAGGADLQEVRRRVGLRRPPRAVPAGRRRVGHRVQDRGHDRRRGRDRRRQPGADQGRPGLHLVRGGRRRPLLPARAQPDRRRREDPRRAGRADHPVPGRAGRGRGGGPRGGARPG